MFNVLKEKNSRNFLIRFGIFMLAVTLGFYLIKIILGNFIPIPTISTNFDRNSVYALFFTGLFLLMIKDDLKNTESPKQNFLQTAVFGVLTILSVIMVQAVFSNIVIASSHNPADLIRLYYIGLLMMVLPSVLAWLTVFNIKFTRNFIKKFGNKAMIAVVLFLLTAIVSLMLQNNWLIFSSFIAKSTSFLLGLTFSSSTSTSIHGTPMLTLEKFTVNIGAPCSGIESASLFFFFYLAIIIFDWKTINKKLAAIAFLPGLIGMYIMNILRLYALMLIGHFISPKLAVSVFHDNAGWVIFVAYIFLFWYIVYPKINKKQP